MKHGLLKIAFPVTPFASVYIYQEPLEAAVGPVFWVEVPPEFLVQSKLSLVSWYQSPIPLSKLSEYGNEVTIVPEHGGGVVVVKNIEEL